MNRISIKNLTNPFEIELEIRYCNKFIPRLIGLMFHPPLTTDDGILLVQQRESQIEAGIHMFFMRTDLTIVWLNADKVVVDKVLAKRWRPFYIPSKPALYVLECSPDRINDFQLGDELDFQELVV